MKAAAALTASAALLTAGVWLLHTPSQDRPTTTPQTTVTTISATTQPTVAATLQPADTTYTPAASSPAPATGPDAPPTSTPITAATAEAGALASADGPAADPTVQAMLEGSVPQNLPAPLEQQLAQLGSKVWLADVTGVGRTQWRTYFTSPGSSGYTDVRVQAAIACRTGGSTVTVTLLWAGTSPAGDVQVGLPGSVKFIQRTGTWEPTQ